MQLSQQFFAQFGVDRFEPPRLDHDRVSISGFQIGEAQIVIGIRLVRLDAGCVFVSSNRLIEPACEEVCVAEFVESLRRAGLQLQGSLVGTNRIFVAALFDFAVTDLNPRFGRRGFRFAAVSK